MIIILAAGDDGGEKKPPQMCSMASFARYRRTENQSRRYFLLSAIFAASTHEMLAISVLIKRHTEMPFDYKALWYHWCSLSRDMIIYRH